MALKREMADVCVHSSGIHKAAVALLLSVSECISIVLITNIIKSPL